jgi:uncharacterized protein YbcV (DUF1398 family)
MSKAIDNLQAAQKRAIAIRPKVGGFPYLAETLRRAGVTRNVWSLPACQSIFLTNDGPVVMQGQPLVSGMADVPAFDREGLIKALRIDQAGDSTFPEFLAASWRSGVVRYDVDFETRIATCSRVPAACSIFLRRVRLRSTQAHRCFHRHVSAWFHLGRIICKPEAAANCHVFNGRPSRCLGPGGAFQPVDQELKVDRHHGTVKLWTVFEPCAAHMTCGRRRAPGLS